jgi:arylsulfatase A-like enzyme
MPTVLAACGAAPPNGIDGRDVLGVLKGQRAAEEHATRDLYFFNGQAGAGREQLALISGAWKLVIAGPDVRKQGYQTPQHRIELYHLAEDPLERVDLAVKHPGRVEQMGRELEVFRRLEPADAIRPANRKPAGFKPPVNWRNAL